LINNESAIKISTIVAKLNFAPGLSSGSSGFVPLPGRLVVKSSSVDLPLTCGCGDESCISESARSAKSRLEGFGAVSEDGIGLGKAGSPKIKITVRMLVTKAARMKYSRASAGDILEMKVERPTNVSIIAEPKARIPEVEDVIS
jgi:hypothetical protein